MQSIAGHDRELGQATALAGQTAESDDAAGIGVTGPAGRAGAAAVGGIDGGAVADLDATHIGPDLDHRAGELMADDLRWNRAGQRVWLRAPADQLGMEVDMKVGPADPA